MSRSSTKKQPAGTKRTTAMRRQDENSELTELAGVLPIPRSSNTVDKISVVRLTTAYVKFRMFLHEANISWDPNFEKAFETGTDLDILHSDTVNLLGGPYGKQQPNKAIQNGSFDLSSMISKAMDSFLLVVAPDGTVLYVPEYVTEYIGLTQAEMIGHSLLDLTHNEDQNSVERNLIYDPTDPSRRQWRQFCVRFRTSLNTPRTPLSKFSGHRMMQISGYLKCTESRPIDRKEHPNSLGLLGECRPIESMSIGELSIQRSSFTTTTSLDLKFTAVESRVKTLIGFDPEEMTGLYAYDFFHPSDFKACQPGSERAVKCRLTLLNQGRVVSPIHRFMTKSGEWIWTQMVCVLSYIPGTKTPFDIKVTFRIVSSEIDRLNLIEHTEAFHGSSVLQEVQEPYKLHMQTNTRFSPQGVDAARNIRSQFTTSSPTTTTQQDREILNSALSSAKSSSAVLDSLHMSREFALQSLSQGHGVRRAIAVDGEELVSLYPPNHQPGQLPAQPSMADAFLQPTNADPMPYSSPVVSGSSGKSPLISTDSASRDSLVSFKSHTSTAATQSVPSPSSGYAPSPSSTVSMATKSTSGHVAMGTQYSPSSGFSSGTSISTATNGHGPMGQINGHVPMTMDNSQNPSLNGFATDPAHNHATNGAMPSGCPARHGPLELSSLAATTGVGSPCPSDSSGFCSIGSPDNGTGQSCWTPPMSSADQTGTGYEAHLPNWDSVPAGDKRCPMNGGPHGTHAYGQGGNDSHSQINSKLNPSSDVNSIDGQLSPLPNDSPSQINSESNPSAAVNGFGGSFDLDSFLQQYST